MNKIIFGFVASALFLGTPSHLRAQILNGSFTETDSGSLSGFADWKVVGGGASGIVGPQVVATGAPVPVPRQAALLQSTNEDFSLSNSASAATLNAALFPVGSGGSLPPTQDNNILDGTYGQSFPAVNGQAIDQTFTLSTTSTLSFDYSYQSDDYYPYDSVGYVLDGVYTELVSTPPYSLLGSDPQTAYTPYPFTITLGAGTHTLGFVSYNTGGHGYSTSLFVTDIATTPVPEPGTGSLMILGFLSLAACARYVRRSRVS